MPLGSDRDSRERSAAANNDSESPDNWLLYDGDCPFCSNYISRLRLQESSNVRLIDARNVSHELRLAHSLGYRIDKGMLLNLDDNLYHGSECISRLSLLVTSSSTFNRWNRRIFASPRQSALLYPLLRLGRNLMVRVMGRGLLND